MSSLAVSTGCQRMQQAMKRFSAPSSVYLEPSNDDGSNDSSKKVKTAHSFEVLFNCESHSDILLNINHGEFVFYAHKMIVGLKSERLAALMTNAGLDSADRTSKPVLYLIEGPECGRVFSRFLYFIYSGAVWLHRDYVVPLLKLSVKYGVGALANHCESYIVQLLNKCLNLDHNCAQALSVSSVCDLYEGRQFRDDTKKAAFCVLSRRFSDLIRTQRWISCAWITVKDLLSCDECVCEENLILVAATDWMKRNKLQDKVRIQEILASIRYPRLPRRVLYHLHTTDSFRNFPHVQDLIDAAIRYHCFKDVPEAIDEFVGSQYRTRGRSRTRNTLCGGETLSPMASQGNTDHKTKWGFDDYNEPAQYQETNREYRTEGHCNSSPDFISNSRDIRHTHHHFPCASHTAHTTRHFQRAGSRTCEFHGRDLNALPTCHQISSPVATAQHGTQDHFNSLHDTEPINSSQDTIIHSHNIDLTASATVGLH